MIKLLLSFVLIILPLASSSEVILLKTGKEIKGPIVDKTDDYVVVDFDGVFIKYYHDQIENIYSQRQKIPVISPVSSLTTVSLGPVSGKINTNQNQTRLRQLLSLYARIQKTFRFMEELDVVIDNVQTQGFHPQYEKNYIYNILRNIGKFSKSEKIEMKKNNNYIADFQEDYLKLLSLNQAFLNAVQKESRDVILNKLKEYFDRYSELLIKFREEFKANDVELYKYQMIDGDLLKLKQLFVSFERHSFEVK